jgi:glycosyltransferase involved in cell wall biosynthesis
MSSVKLKSRVLIVGPIIIDDKSSGGEGEKLYKALKQEGYSVLKVSGKRNKLIRLIHTLLVVFFFQFKYDKVVLMVFSGRAFFLELVVQFICRIIRKPVIAIIHGGAFPDFYNENLRIASYFLKHCSIIATPSNYIQNYFIKENYNIKYIPNFVDLNMFKTKLQSANFKILWVRAFENTYNPELIINAMPIVLNKFPRATLTMVGPDKGLRRSCIDLISDLGLTEKIELKGFIPNSELPEIYQEHDLFVNTTRYESFGVCLVEAAACGLPIVSVAVGEIPYVWTHNKNIKLTERDPAQFADAICDLFSNRDLYIKTQENAKQLIENYTWPEVSEIWNDLLEAQCAE